ncbi:MAG: hypothetical protein KC448_13980 [Yoonia sp.]|nr:hypothetical protein [Yoonia sp.]
MADKPARRVAVGAKSLMTLGVCVAPKMLRGLRKELPETLHIRAEIQNAGDRVRLPNAERPSSARIIEGRGRDCPQ